MTPTLLYSTFPTIESAKAISQLLVKEKLAACVNIAPEGISVYEWEGKMECDSEVYAWIKTSEEHFENIEKLFAAEHPNDVPCLIQVRPSEINKPYLEWLNSQLG